jgi:hypothetical protein
MNTFVSSPYNQPLHRIETHLSHRALGPITWYLDPLTDLRRAARQKEKERALAPRVDT